MYGPFFDYFPGSYAFFVIDDTSIIVSFLSIVRRKTADQNTKTPSFIAVLWFYFDRSSICLCLVWFYSSFDITLGNNRESTLRLCYRFRQNNCGLSQSECTLQIQSTNNPTRAHQFRSGGSALHRNACYRMFTCTNKFCIKLYMQYAFIVCIILRCLFSPFVVVISKFAWFLRVLLTLYIYFVASLIFPERTHITPH